MKKTILPFLLAAICQMGFAQVDPNPLNMSLISQVDYNQSLNDIWGWAAPDGTEYALVGLRNGVSIVSLADPENPVEVANIPGQGTTWRDIKTWEDHAYVVSDNTTEGMLVIDLSGLPGDAPYYYWTPTLEGFGVLQNAHNIYVDEFGYCYLAGSNLNNGGMIFLDVATDPANPAFVGAGPAVYAHDVYARDNRMYASEIYLGRAGIYAVDNKENPQLLATQTTPNQFTHNIWLSDNGNVMFTTDERGNAPVAAYDISDLDNIVELDQYRPIETVGQGVIPHNVHVWNDWLVISYYTDGGIIVDASRPQNLIEVGNFDTFLGGNGGFSGAWGLYPFLPSGRVLVSDIGNGLYILDANYVRACWLEGTVTDVTSGNVLSGVSVEIFSNQANMGQTDLNGKYATGQAIPGTFQIEFIKAGYQPKMVEATLQNGEVTILDVELSPLSTVSITGKTIRDADGNPVANAKVFITNETLSYNATSDENGNFTVDDIFEDTYDVFVGAWGYLHQVAEQVDIVNSSPLIFELEEGYQDDFILDFEWITDAQTITSTGFWTRDEPAGTTYGNQTSNPDFDVPGDFGNLCYVTGNGGGGAADDDVDGGSVTLTSPVMDLSDYNDPIVSYNAWFFNSGGDGNPNDELVISVSNGTDEVVLQRISNSLGFWRPRSVFHLIDFIEITDQMQIIIETSDFEPDGHLVEAAFDAFLVEEGEITSTIDLDDSHASIVAFPNPFSNQLTVNYELSQSFDQAFLHVYNAVGQRVQTIQLGFEEGQLQLGNRLNPGLYLLQIEADGKVNQSVKVIKSEN